jgi:hypothetical protein
MPNQRLDKGNFLLLEYAVTAFDGSPDVLSAANVTPVNNPLALLIEPIPGPAGQASRSAYVSVPPALNSSVPNVPLQVAVTIPGSGGVSPTSKSLQILIDVFVPPDLRSLSGSLNIAGQQPMPHP